MAVYNDCTSLYVTIKFIGKSTGSWVGEMWQTGIRLMVDVDGPGAPGAGRIDPSAFGVQDAGATRTTTNWSILQGWTGVSIGGNVITDDDINDILAAIREYVFQNVSYMSNEFVFDTVKIYPMLPGGGTPFKAGKTATAPIIATQVGTAMNPSGTTTLPPDVSLAVSFGSATRGVSGRGRMFLGSLAVNNVAATGLVAATPKASWGNYGVAMINDFREINSADPTGMKFTPVIYTKVPNKVGQYADTGSVINLVRISDEFDTQRRRDHQRNDVYTSYGTVV